MVAQVDDLAEFCQQQLDVDRRGLGGGAQAGVDEVPVVVEAVGQAAQLLEGDAELEGHQHREGVVRVAEQLVDDARPPLVEVDQRRHLVHDLDRRRQPGLDGVLDEDPLGEGVEGAQGGAVEVDECRRRHRRLRSVAAGQVLEPAPHPVTQLGGGPVGEGDGGQVLDRHPGHDQRHDALDEGAGLAGAGPGLDEQGGAEVGGDPVAGRLVDGEAVRMLSHHRPRGR